ncbi:MAG: alpha/beta hydrolase [Saccharofermentanales bacterium]
MESTLKEKKESSENENSQNENTDSFLAMKDGTRLFYTREYTENMKAVIVIVHGVGEHSGRYKYLAERLNMAGYGVVRFDLRGHGKSGGERGFVNSFLDFSDDTDEIVEKVKKDKPGIPIFMLAHSMGAFIAAIYSIRYPGRIDGQILSGIPATILPLTEIRMLKLLPYNAFPRIKMGNSLGTKVSRDQSVVDDYITDPLNLKKATIKMSSEMFIKGPEWLAKHANEYEPPCLILHAGDDLIVTPASSEWFYDNIASVDKRRKIYPGLYHEIYNEKERDSVIADVVDWLNDK